MKIVVSNYYDKYYTYIEIKFKSVVLVNVLLKRQNCILTPIK